jgi:SAM-dependent methyltransferase
MPTFDDKLEVRKQWDTDPCGAVTAAPVTPESAEWYASVRRHRYENYAPWLLRLIDARRWRGADVLEIGVGLGSDHLTLAEAGARMHALDLSAEHLRHTRRNLELHGFHTDAQLGDAEHNPWPDDSFDLVYSFGVLHHTPGIGHAVREAWRVLRPGGTALIAVYHRDSWFYWVFTILWRGILRLGLWRKGKRRLLSEIEYRSAANEALPLVNVYSREQARALFAGFEHLIVSAHGVDTLHFPPPINWFRRGRPTAWMERWLSFGGWYLVIRATKGRGRVAFK